MSFVILHADAFVTTATDDPVVAAGDIDRFRDVVALLEGAAKLRCATEDAVADARAEGFAAGRTEGLRASDDDIRAEWLRLAARDGAIRRERQAEIAHLALAVVRRIAGDIGVPAFVAGLAERATAAIAPDEGATVRVAPAVTANVRARLEGRPGIIVKADATLDDTDCVIDTALGQVRAGLEVQLGAIEHAWRDLPSDDLDGD
jgi:flagellar biosynthesis/type III secretory pathway protein FliH